MLPGAKDKTSISTLFGSRQRSRVGWQIQDAANALEQHTEIGWLRENRNGAKVESRLHGRAGFVVPRQENEGDLRVQGPQLLENVDT